MVIGHTGVFDFSEKNFKIFVLVWFRARYKPSLVFRLSPVCSNSKLKFSPGVDLKSTSHGKPGLKDSFLPAAQPAAGLQAAFHGVLLQPSSK